MATVAGQAIHACVARCSPERGMRDAVGGHGFHCQRAGRHGSSVGAAVCPTLAMHTVWSWRCEEEEDNKALVVADHGERHQAAPTGDVAYRMTSLAGGGSMWRAALGWEAAGSAVGVPKSSVRLSLRIVRIVRTGFHRRHVARRRQLADTDRRLVVSRLSLDGGRAEMGSTKFVGDGQIMKRDQRPISGERVVEGRVGSGRVGGGRDLGPISFRSRPFFLGQARGSARSQDQTRSRRAH